MQVWSRGFAGRPECLSEVRCFILAVLGDCDTAHVVALIADELVANAIKHTASGGPGGELVLRLTRFADRCRVRVDDQGGSTMPAVRVAEDDEEAGRGLTIVALLSAHWGVDGDEKARSVWAEITFDEVAAIPGPPANGLPRELRTRREVGMAMDDRTR
ncbi:putative signal transduction histidine kinase [Catenulispora acidiphila DSM 44928]|uniref:Putative signal transduction histidine kinase n=1 Tax=Catenulispora acidiphila (strain DSM 44928 / JCM 14897 / NBRC 102108 / NRRL B-24433 / ID139908) TaxID=479433 RepID=C7PYT4_CATAD|nr:ATP-binding protein [Catenulispora acidiphila]ACU77406.1 putative signal transduction histidine kinase [Catenulispora acidiphila DSM 44928]